MRGELNLLGPRRRKPKFQLLLQKWSQLMPLSLPHLGFKHTYAIEWQHWNSRSKIPSQVELIRVEKIEEKNDPVSLLLTNFCCSTIEDVRELQENPHRLDGLNLGPEEVKNLLNDVLFIFEKRQKLEKAAARLRKPAL